MKTSTAEQQAKTVNDLRAKGWTIHRSKIATVVFAVKTKNDRTHVMAWRGNAANPVWNYLFKSPAQAERYAKELVETVKRSEAYRATTQAEKKAKRDALKAADHWTVGDVAYTSWGYDQTNVEYFQITKVKNRSVYVRQIRVNSSDRGQPGGGKVAPRRYEFIGPEFLCPLDESGSFNAGPCHNGNKPAFRHHCSKWNGRAVYTSSDR